MNSLRIDFVITELFVGGAERCLTELAIGMSEAGDRVRVFSMGSLPLGEQRMLVDRMRRHGISVETANADSWRQTHRAFRHLRAWFAESIPDVTQTFLFHANVIGTWAARAAGVPVCVGGMRVAESKRLRCWVERQAVRRMDRVICVSQGVRRFVSDQLHCPDEKLAVIPNGLDVERFEKAVPVRWQDLGWPSDSVVTLFVGRLHPQKGIEQIQQQIDCIAPLGSHRRLLLVGDGPLREPLTQWVRRLGADRVQMLGWQADVAPLIKACRVLVLPSHYEGMPNVALEAMAAGRPVVCSRIQGADELFSHRFDEQTFAPGDLQAMKNLIESFLLDEARSDQLGRENQQRVAREFSIAGMVDAYRRLYRELRCRAD